MRRLVFGLGMSQVVLTTAAISGMALLFGNTVEVQLGDRRLSGAVLDRDRAAAVGRAEAAHEPRRPQHLRGAAGAGSRGGADPVPDRGVRQGGGRCRRRGAAATGSVWFGLLMALTQAAAAILLIVGFGRLILRKLFRQVAHTHNRELFMATILFVVVGTSLLTHVAGLSMALGAFLAGLVLAETEFRRQVEVDIEPFKGMLLGLFFISVGMRIDLAEVARYPEMVATSVIGMVALKAVVIAALARLFGLSWPIVAEASLLLAGGGEFAFLVLGLASSSGLVTHEVEQFMLLVSSGTMMLTPYLARLSVKASTRVRNASAMADGYAEPGPVEPGRIIVVGYGRVGRILGDILIKQDKSLHRHRDRPRGGAQGAQGRTQSGLWRRHPARLPAQMRHRRRAGAGGDDARRDRGRARRRRRPRRAPRHPGDRPRPRRRTRGAAVQARRQRSGARGAGSELRNRLHRAADAGHPGRQDHRDHPRRTRRAKKAGAARAGRRSEDCTRFAARRFHAI